MSSSLHSKPLKQHEKIFIFPLIVKILNHALAFLSQISDSGILLSGLSSRIILGVIPVICLNWVEKCEGELYPSK